MKNIMRNERGSGVVLTIFSLAIVAIMLILVLNISMVFVKKEQASIAAEHASIAATGIIYENVERVINSHVKERIVGVDENGLSIIESEPLMEKVLDEQKSIAFLKPWLSKNEAYIQAVNTVLLVELLDDQDLNFKINEALQAAKDEIPAIIQHMIKENLGNETEFEWKLDVDYRIEVIAKTEFEAVHYDSIRFGKNQFIPQRGKGPSIAFIERVGW